MVSSGIIIEGNYVSKDYDVSGTWVAAQAPEGANFKFEATVGSGKADGGLWYKLPLDQDTVEITYYDDQIKQVICQLKTTLGAMPQAWFFIM